MKPGLFEFEVHVAGFKLTCVNCKKFLYLSEASEPNTHDGRMIQEIAAKHDCPNLKKEAA